MNRICLILVLLSLAFAPVVKAQISADFTFSEIEGCGSLQVSFCDNSISTAGSIVSWDWDLAGTGSNVECPGKIFGQPGVYTICLTVTDNLGNTDTACKSDLITVHTLPQANYTASITQGCVPLEVTFTDFSTSTDGQIVEWLWGLGGSCGTISANLSTSPNCTYPLPDNYGTSLTVIDEFGCLNTSTIPNHLIVSPIPEIDVMVSDSFICNPPVDVTFTNNGLSQDITYTWDFGNNETFTGHDPPAITYTENGIYDITVTAENTQTGCMETLIMEDYIEVGYPMGIEFSHDTVCMGEWNPIYDLNPSGIQADSVEWDFGDGTFSHSGLPWHAFNITGCFHVTLTRIVDGCSVSYTSPNCITVLPQPEVTLINDNNLGCSLPHIVNFTSIAPTATSWHWDFGNGDTSIISNPTYSFEEFGIYDVTLTVTNEEGCSVTSDISTITVLSTDVGIAQNGIGGCAPFTFTLDDNSFSVTPLTDWEWEILTPNGSIFGSGETSTFTIPDTGVFDVVLSVNNTLGCAITDTISNVVQVGNIPTVQFSGDPLYVCIEEPVFFTDESSDFADSWLWTFGDLLGSPLQHPNHGFIDTGFYDIGLTVGHNGCLNSLELTDYVYAAAPVSIFEWTTECASPYARFFESMSVDADSLIWDFGVSGTNTDMSNEITPTFVYPDVGSYDVTLTAINVSTGCSHIKQQTVNITAPNADFEISTTSGCGPLDVFITDHSEFAIKWLWDAPGGTVSNINTSEPTITYPGPGTYSNIQLIISDEHLCKDTMILTDEILVNTIEVQIGTSVEGGCLPLTAQFFDNSVNTFATNVEWAWEIADESGFITSQNPTYVFEELGTFPVTLTVKDDWGCFGTATEDAALEVTEPVAYFESDSIGCTQHFVTFNQLSTIQQTTNYHWDFGDNSTSDIENPTHYYSNEGLYTVCLTITDIYDCTSTFCRDDYVNIANPMAGFSIDSTFASCPPLPVNFMNTSVNATTYQWDFGDGTGASDLPNPSKVYTIPGIYAVELIASTTSYCADTLVVDNLVVLEGPEGDFSLSIDSSCVNTEITFIANSVDDYLYIWDFGNGIIDSSSTTLLTDTTSVIYDEPGVYFPGVSFVSSTGCNRFISSPTPLIVTNLVADFEAVDYDTLLCDNAPLEFIDLSESLIPIMSYNWIFEGGMPDESNVSNPFIQYDNPGNYDVQLIVENGLCVDTLFIDDYIKVGSIPLADFGTSIEEGCEPLPVFFSDSSTITYGTIVDWHWDFGDNETSDIVNPVHVFSADTSIIISLTVTSDFGCTNTASDTIANIYPIPQVSITEELAICIGEYTQLEVQIESDTTDLIYYWTPSDSLSCDDCLDPVANPVDTTTYYFVVSTPQGCIDSIPVIVNVKPFPIPVITISEDTLICPNDLTQLFVNGGDNVYSYQWDEEYLGLSCYDDCLNPIATPEFSTTYTVTVTNVYGCQSKDSVRVDVMEQFQEIVGEDRIVCEGDTVHLFATMGNEPTWLVNTDLTCSYCYDPIADPEESITYMVRVISDEGCEIFDSIQVNIIHPEDVDAGEDETICMGQSIDLNGVGEGDVSWSPTASLVNATSLKPTTNSLQSTMYYLTLSNGDCVMTDSVMINIVEESIVEINDVTVCEGQSAQLEAGGFAENFTWMPNDDLSALDISNPIATPIDTTMFTVIGSISSCRADTANVMVNVISKPEIDVITNRNFFPGQTVELNIEVNDPSQFTYEWSPAEGLSCTSCPSPSVTPDSSQLYSVLVTDLSTGCITIEQIQVTLLDGCPEYLISVPNAFSPDGDGINDELKIYSSSAIEQIFVFSIYNRWGEEVFRTENLYEGWDGTKNGKLQTMGVYLYYLEAKCELNNSKIIKQGDLTLIR